MLLRYAILLVSLSVVYPSVCLSFPLIPAGAPASCVSAPADLYTAADFACSLDSIVYYDFHFANHNVPEYGGVGTAGLTLDVISEASKSPAGAVAIDHLVTASGVLGNSTLSFWVFVPPDCPPATQLFELASPSGSPPVWNTAGVRDFQVYTPAHAGVGEFGTDGVRIHYTPEPGARMLVTIGLLCVWVGGRLRARLRVSATERV